ncbi:MAG: hypothetical protein JRN39_04220 [Nitrososphaerota archaeon]|nr:hypothetical protein [Nitrososphaerota archaeon]MDG6939590.1 hypothetical protein [Nitrososphaerota archaeon]
MSFDILSLVLGGSVGAAVAAAASYAAMRQKKKGSEPEPRKSDFGLEGRLVVGQEIEAAKRDLKLLKMEKEYLSNALTRIYEAEARGVINKEERVTLSQKYRSQLKDVDEKLAKASMVVEVSDLEDARSELVGLFTQKISQIDGRLEQLKDRILPFAPAIETVPEPTRERKEKAEEKKEKPTVVDDRLKKVVQNVNEVMTKLEQLDLEE